MASADRRRERSVLTSGVVAGVAAMGAIDEIVFHQLLQWHHFYVHTTRFWQTFSDGLFHLFTASVWFVAVLLLWRRRALLARAAGGRAFWGAFLLGMGGFQTFDGVVSHRLLGLHPVRVGADPMWPYDVLWIASGLVLVAQGWVLRRAAARRRVRPT